MSTTPDRRTLLKAALAVGAGALPASALHAQSGGRPVFLSLGTSTVGGTNHILGSGISRLVRDDNPDIRIAAEITGGGIENLKLAEAGRVQMGLSTADTVYDSYHGANQFGFAKANKNLRGIASGYPVKGQIYTLAKSDIRRITDLKGKKVSVGARGSLGNVVMPVILEAYGMKAGVDWRPEYLGHGEGATALGDGQVDAVLAFGSTPSPALTSVSTSHEIRLLSIDKDKLQQLVAPRPFWKATTIPPGIYRRVDYAVDTLLIGIALFVDKDVPDDVVYRIAKSIFENTEKFAKIHPEGATFTVENVGMAIDGIIPYHPGAERYLRERKVLK